MVPWSPAESFATSSLIIAAPTGTPAPSALPTATDPACSRGLGSGTRGRCGPARSGLHPQYRAPVRRSRAIGGRKRRRSGRTPPSPWMGSTMIAASVVTAAASAAGSSATTNVTPARAARTDPDSAGPHVTDSEPDRPAVERVVNATNRPRASRPACTSSDARTSDRPRPPRCRCCRRTRGRVP